MIAIIISDLRSLPVAAAISLRYKLGYKNSTLFMSSAILQNVDYGQYRNYVLRWIQVYSLVYLFGAKIVNDKLIKNEIIDVTGVLSSLYSITNDSKATKYKYITLWKSLVALHIGALALVDDLSKHKIEKIYIFNGRLASSYAISKYAASENINAFFYEYANSEEVPNFTRYFTLTNFSVHKLEQWGIDLLKTIYLAKLKLIRQVSVIKLQNLIINSQRNTWIR
jgi:hypothetical protein